jgi:hypothetical protein
MTYGTLTEVLQSYGPNRVVAVEGFAHLGCADESRNG